MGCTICCVVVIGDRVDAHGAPAGGGGDGGGSGAVGGGLVTVSGVCLCVPSLKPRNMLFVSKYFLCFHVQVGSGGEVNELRHSCCTYLAACFIEEVIRCCVWLWRRCSPRETIGACRKGMAVCTLEVRNNLDFTSTPQTD